MSSKKKPPLTNRKKKEKRELSKRKFYVTKYEITLLSDEPIDGNLTLEDISYLMTEGHCSGDIMELSPEIVSGKVMAELLIDQRSDPEFLGLTSEGEDAEDDS